MRVNESVINPSSHGFKDVIATTCDKGTRKEEGRRRKQPTKKKRHVIHQQMQASVNYQTQVRAISSSSIPATLT